MHVFSLAMCQEAMQRLQAEKNELHQTVLQQQALLSAGKLLRFFQVVVAVFFLPNANDSIMAARIT